MSPSGGPLPFLGDAGRQVTRPILPSAASTSHAPDSAIVVIYTIKGSCGQGAMNSKALAGPVDGSRFERLAPFS